MIFFMYLYGYTCAQIADTLTKLGRRTKKNNTSWSPKSILQILQNERHCGDVLARKTWTPNYLDHKSKKNRQNRNQYRKRNHHDAIISRDDFIAVQHLISNAKYGNKGILPELQVIRDGVLKGFVSINPRWVAFSADDYRAASNSVLDDECKLQTERFHIEAHSGDFDLRGYEIARSQFFDTARKICVTLSADCILFSTECIRKFDKALYIEMLVNPSEHLLVARPCTKETRNAVKWANLNEGQYFPRPISCAAYIKTLYELFGWKSGCKYRVRGIYRQKDDEAAVIFDMRDTEILIPQDTLEFAREETMTDDLLPGGVRPFTTGPKKDIMAYPSSWANTFGSNFYRHAQALELAALANRSIWNINEEGQPFYDSQTLKVTNAEVVGDKIKQMINDMEQETFEDGK